MLDVDQNYGEPDTPKPLPTFKDYVAQDVETVFFNLNEFAEERYIDDKHLIDIQKNIGNELAAMSVMEMTTSFAQEMAVKATGKPVEFFKLMPRGKIKKVQAAVVKGMDNSENADEVKKQLESHTLKFAAPYTYEGSEKAELKGKTFDSIDLSGVGELNTMSESMAENRMAAGGFAPVNTHRNYLYCCIIASMGTGYPVDFFAGLPLCEAVKLRDAVNSDFFE